MLASRAATATVARGRRIWSSLTGESAVQVWHSGLAPPNPDKLRGPCLRVVSALTRTGCREPDRGRWPTMLRDRGGSERGSVAITVALALTVLLGLAALVVDVGLNWAARTSAQTAADSAALAGASTLLLDGPAAAFETVETFLSNNQVIPAAAGWADDGLVSNGEIVCWTMPNDPPAPPPGPGLNCPDGSNALQVITPPINVQYAFAPILGRASNSIKATAAAGAGPAAPNNCVLCLLEPNLPNGLAVTSNGGVDDDPGGGQFSPPPQLGGPPVADPLADLPTPDALALPPPCCSGPQLIVSDTT